MKKQKNKTGNKIAGSSRCYNLLHQTNLLNYEPFSFWKLSCGLRIKMRHHKLSVHYRLSSSLWQPARDQFLSVGKYLLAQITSAHKNISLGLFYQENMSLHIHSGRIYWNRCAYVSCVDMCALKIPKLLSFYDFVYTHKKAINTNMYIRINTCVHTYTNTCMLQIYRPNYGQLCVFHMRIYMCMPYYNWNQCICDLYAFVCVCAYCVYIHTYLKIPKMFPIYAFLYTQKHTNMYKYTDG